MAILFDDTQSEYLTVASSPVTAAPITIAMWARSNDATLGQPLFSIFASGDTLHQWLLSFGGADAGDPVTFRARAGAAAAVIAVTTTGYTVNTWHHVCGIERSATSRDVYIDGGSKGSNTTSRAPAGINSVHIGAAAALGTFFSGDIAEAAIWNVALTDAEVALLAKPVSPLFIRPNDLVAYWPLWGRYSPEIDLIGRRELTWTNTPVASGTHPRLYYPA